MPTENDNTPPAGEWYKGIEGADAPIVEVLAAKGWDKMTPAQAAVAAARSYHGAQSLIGAPPEELVRLPKDPASPDWNKVHTRLGRPEAADKYDFTAVKFKDGSLLPPDFVKTMQDKAFGANLSSKAANDMVSALVETLDAREGTRIAENSAKVLTQKGDLAKLWKTSVDGLQQSPQMMQAQNAARALGVPKETIDQLEQSIGYDKVMEMFRSIGSRMREDNYISPTPGSGIDNVITPAQAEQQKATLMKDAGFVAKYNAGDVEARKQMSALNRVIHGITVAA